MTSSADSTPPLVTSVGVHEAKTHLSRLLRLVDAGHEIEIRRNGEVVARLVAPAAAAVRAWGMDEGTFHVPDDFDDPLPDEILDGFYG